MRADGVHRTFSDLEEKHIPLLQNLSELASISRWKRAEELAESLEPFGVQMIREKDEAMQECFDAHDPRQKDELQAADTSSSSVPHYL